MSSVIMRSFQAQRALMKCQAVKFASVRALASHGSAKAVNPQGWKSWKDIPDSALPKAYDPSNPLYETATYKKLQKKRIWYQIPDGTPVYFKEGLKDRVLVYSYSAMLFSFLAYEYYIIVTKVAV